MPDLYAVDESSGDQMETFERINRKLALAEILRAASREDWAMCARINDEARSMSDEFDFPDGDPDDDELAGLAF